MCEKPKVKDQKRTEGVMFFINQKKKYCDSVLIYLIIIIIDRSYGVK